MKKDECIKVESFLRKTFKLDTIKLKSLPKKDDSLEVYIEDEFIGLVYRDDEEGELSYSFQMAILDYDLN
ncbi:DUF3126 family protein [Hyphomicrobiales bacterium]|jgi:hypothetical protein|nr:DUF3126 family protein [Rhodobiaceae bacterium]MBT5640355.1 DUF3126 family protein [Rhodobiaceae bacterium]MDC0139296.1 DUF3126 family protein [Hyphomicrobiales bacterium]MDC3272890.1 DUF3126 family protein [Hyphomicrobiales bacterium]